MKSHGKILRITSNDGDLLYIEHYLHHDVPRYSRHDQEEGSKFLFKSSETTTNNKFNMNS